MAVVASWIAALLFLAWVFLVSLGRMTTQGGSAGAMGSPLALVPAALLAVVAATVAFSTYRRPGSRVAFWLSLPPALLGPLILLGGGLEKATSIHRLRPSPPASFSGGQLVRHAGGEPVAAVAVHVEAFDRDAPGVLRLPGPKGEEIWLVPQPVLTNPDLDAVFVETDGTRHRVRITLQPAAGERLRSVTAANVGRKLALLSNGKVVALVLVVEPVGSDVAIDAGATAAEALALGYALVPRAS